VTACVNCDSRDAELFRGGDGRFRKRCPDCGYEWGPFASDQNTGGADGPPAEGQAGLGDFA
jgi:predicted  nucleic acid-binding Zn-ribbon protein